MSSVIAPAATDTCCWCHEQIMPHQCDMVADDGSLMHSRCSFQSDDEQELREAIAGAAHTLHEAAREYRDLHQLPASMAREHEARELLRRIDALVALATGSVQSDRAASAGEHRAIRGELARPMGAR